VLDVNDNSPVFNRSSYAVEVSEDAAEGTKVLGVSRNGNLDHALLKKIYIYIYIYTHIYVYMYIFMCFKKVLY